MNLLKQMVDGFAFKFTGFKNNGRVLDSKQDGTVYSHAYNGGLYQKWVAKSFGNNKWRLMNAATGLVLDSNGAGAVYALSDNGGDFQRWEVSLTTDGTHVSLKNVQTQKWLSHRYEGDSDVDKVFAEITEYDGSARWDLEFWDVVFDTDIVSMIFGQGDYAGRTPPSVVNAREYNNSSNETQDHEYTYTYSESHEFTLSFTESVGIAATVEVSAGVPEIASSKGSVTMDARIDVNQTSTTSDVYEYSFKEDVVVGPLTRLEVRSDYEKATDITLPFTMVLRITASRDGSPLGAPDVKMCMDTVLGNTGKFNRLDGDDGILLGVTGTMKTGYGLGAHVSWYSVPSIITLTPPAAPPGQAVKLAGTGASVAKSVMFGPDANAIAATILERTSPDEILIEVPLMPPGETRVVLWNTGLESDEQKFTVL